MSMVDKTFSQSGFALLMSLIVVGVVLSVGLVILDLTIKQVRLAVTTRDSEIAFHAANAGAECALHWRRQDTVEADIFNDAAVTGAAMPGVRCFGSSASNVAASGGSVINGIPEAEQYEYEFSWPPGSPDRCTRINMVVIADSSPVSIPESSIRALIPGHSFGGGKTCTGGSRCTLIATSGYNQSCPGAGGFGYGVVERKVLIEL